MSQLHTILVTVDEPFRASVDATWVEEAARGILQAEGVPPAELGVLVTHDARLRELNREYAGEDEATDVLSFSLTEGEKFASPDGVLRLGEVIISYPTAERQGREAGRSTEAEIAHLIVHGILHLLGYDHAEPEEERQMRAREQELLGASL
jgi:probable rRNA maturation factor